MDVNGWKFGPDNGRHDVFETAAPPKTVNTNGFEASMPALPHPAENARGGVFSAAESTKHREYRCGRPVRGAREQRIAATNKKSKTAA